ncbi:unnamed protein product [Rotaria magnacalcarata]|uniref:KAP NTPase domain-containing protein n=6 Tax=Rotaria magnacalcarata TaxID=392030 RepID=A0A815QFS8_9BILA|nr:unnamed protein product [Rotaria magnacalcarata]
MANVFLQFLIDVENGDLDSVKRNIQNGIDLETRDEDQQTALILAARCNHFESVKSLVEVHADVNAEDVDHWTALLNACQNGNLDIVCFLTEHGAHIEHCDCGQFTPLMWASYQGHTRVVEYLLSCGTNIDAQDEHGISSLSWASGRNHIDIVALLLAAGASPNLCDKNNTSPLIWASRRGYTRVIDLLLKHNANVNNIGMKNMTALLASTKGGHAETALCLLQNSTIDIKIQDKDGQTPLSHACGQGLTDVVAELVERHAYVNTVDKNLDPVLFSAVKSGKEDCVAILLEKHADINVVGAENKTAIWWAVECGRLGVVKYLLQYSPDVEVAGGHDDDTPLLLATKRKRVGIVYELIKYGAKLSSVDRFGDNSLHIALRNCSRDITDILLSNPRHSKYLYRPNKRGETPYKIDATLQKSILTTIFGQRTLNLNDDSILGYDLYSSALAEILSEPSLRTPITVGLYAKWGSGKSALLAHLKDEMYSFAQLTDFPSIKFSPLLLSVIFITGSIIGLIIGFLIHYTVGISIGCLLIIFPLVFLYWIKYFLRNKDYGRTASVARFINKRLEILRFLLQVLFINPYAHHRLKTDDATDCKKMKFIFTEYGKVSTVEGEKVSATMIAELATNVEETFGLVATRLCRALHSKNLSRDRFRNLCCVPAFIFVTIQILVALVLSILIFIKGIPSVHGSINTVYILLTSILAISIVFSLATWLRILMALMRSPKSKIMKLLDQSSHLNESSLYRLKKEVNRLSYIIKTVEAFLNINTRLVVLIDGLDVCEQQRILQILDQVHVLLTKENDPFITLIVCDPHKMIPDAKTTASKISLSANQHSSFESGVNGHEYLLSIIQLPIYLQLNLSRTKQQKDYGNDFPKRRQTTLPNGTSVLDVSTKPTIGKKLSKNKRRRQRRDTLPNTKPVTTSELTHQLLQSDYFLDVNPRILQRLINIIAMSGRLLRANQILFSWTRLGCWSYLVEQWPYRISWIVVHYEDYEQDYAEDAPLKTLYNKIKQFIPILNDTLLELDRNRRKFELCIENSEPVLNLMDLKQFLPSTCNLDPYLNRFIRESVAYFYMNNSHENSFTLGDSSNFFSPRDSTFAINNPFFQQVPTPRNQTGIYPNCNLGQLEFAGAQCRPNALISMKKRDGDENDNQIQVSSISSRSAASTKQPTLSNDVKVDLSPSLSQMTINDICDCLKNDIAGMKLKMIPTYIRDINENNINGRVLLACDFDELKQTVSMTFGDWVLFRAWVRRKREEEQCSRLHIQPPSASTTNNNNNNNNNDDHQQLLNSDPYNEYQFYSGNSVLSSALDQLFSRSTQKNIMNSSDRVHAEDNSNKISIIAVSKNVTFLIPSDRSGITSNDSTFDVNESTTRTIAPVEDIFPVNSSLQSQTITSNEINTVAPSSSSNSVANSLLLEKDQQQEIVRSASEEIPLLTSDNLNDK